MQTVTLSEFCRIVKKVLRESKGKLSLANMGENQGTCVETGISTEESLGIEEAVCMKSVVRNWRDPTHHRKVKRKCISLAKSYF